MLLFEMPAIVFFIHGGVTEDPPQGTRQGSELPVVGLD